MRIVKFLATVTLGFFIGEVVNEYRNCKTSPDFTLKDFLHHYLEETKEAVGFASNLAAEPGMTRTQYTKEMSEHLLFPKKK